MKPIPCLGCKTYFQKAEILPLESLSIEFKNFPFPIKQSRHKWTLLKTIISFLNSKGGTIYIGVDDQSGQVQGNPISRKQQDQFKLFIKQLLERINPQIDLDDKEEVQVQFVPVVNKKKFKSQYVIKIIVKQGNPARIYCFSQKISLNNQEIPNKTEDYEIVYAYIRHNMGGLEELKGMKLIDSVAQKAQKPSTISNIFHEDCNPSPLILQVNVKRIAFGNVNEYVLRDIFQKILADKFKQMRLEYQLMNDVDNNVIVIQFETEEDYKKSAQYVKENLEIINKCDPQVQFVYKGIILDYDLYENIKTNRQRVRSRSRSLSRGKYGPFKPYKFPEEKQKQQQDQDEGIKKTTINTDGGYFVSFTHINYKKKDSLLLDLRQMAKKNGEYTFKQYIYTNTIDLLFPTLQQQQNFYNLCISWDKQLQKYGYNEELFYGAPMGSIRIVNYDKRSRKDLLKYITKLIGEDAKLVQFLHENNKFFLMIKLKEKSMASKWLDTLLTDNQLKKYRNEQNTGGKMKIMLDCMPIDK